MRVMDPVVAHPRGVTPNGRTDTGWPRTIVGTVSKIVTIWLDRIRQRRALYLLDDRLLQDIGLDRLDVQREIDKPFWDR